MPGSFAAHLRIVLLGVAACGWMAGSDLSLARPQDAGNSTESAPQPLDFDTRLALDLPEYPEAGEKSEALHRLIEDLYYIETDSADWNRAILDLRRIGLPALGTIDASLTDSPVRVRIALARAWLSIHVELDRDGALTLYRILELLKDPHWEIREIVVQDLSEHFRPEFLPYLLDALRDPIWRVRLASLGGLGKLKDDRIASMFYECLRKEADEQLQAELVKLLGGFGYAPARDDFYRYLDSPNVQLSISSLGALIKIDGLNDPRLQEGLKQMISQFDRVGDDREMLAALSDAFRTAGSAAMGPLIERYRSESNPQVQNAIAGVLESIENDDKYAALAELIRGETQNMNRVDRCVRILRAGPEEVVLPLATDLFEKMKNPQGRQKVVEVLRDFKSEAARALILTLIDAKERDLVVRQQALQIMAYNPDPGYVPALTELINNDKQDNLRTVAANTLMQCVPQDDFSQLIELYNEISNQNVRTTLMTGLVNKASNAPKEQASILREFFSGCLDTGEVDMQVRAVDGLGRLNAVDMREKFQAMGLNRDLRIEVRSAIVAVLGREDWIDRSSLPVFEYVFKNHSDRNSLLDAVNGFSTLAREKYWGDNSQDEFDDFRLRQWDMFVEYLQRDPSQTDANVRDKLARVIPSIAKPEWLPQLYPFLENRDPSVRQNFLRVFAGETENPDLVPYLHSFIKMEETDDQLTRAYTLLANQKDPRSESLFLGVLKDSEVPGMRRQAIDYAGDMKLKEALPFIHKELGEDNRYLKSYCISALSKIADPSSIPVLKTQMEGTYAENAVIALGQFGLAEADALVVEYARKRFANKYGSELYFESARLLNDILPGVPALARREYERSLESVDETPLPFHPAACMRLGSICELEGDIDAALQYRRRAYTLAVKMELSNIENVTLYAVARDAYKTKVEMLAAQGRKDEVVRLLTEYLDLDGSGKAHNFAAWKLAESGFAPDTAIAWAKVANEKEPDRAYIVDTLAWAYYQAGDKKAALAQVERAVELDREECRQRGKSDTNPNYRYRLAVVRAALGDAAGAAEALDSVLQSTATLNADILAQPEFKTLRESDTEFAGKFDALVTTYNIKPTESK